VVIRNCLSQCSRILIEHNLKIGVVAFLSVIDFFTSVLTSDVSDSTTGTFRRKQRRCTVSRSAQYR